MKNNYMKSRIESEYLPIERRSDNSYAECRCGLIYKIEGGTPYPFHDWSCKLEWLKEEKDKAKAAKKKKEKKK